jgi:hypothetical protein
VASQNSLSDKLLTRDPSVALGAATKQYVDAQVQAAQTQNVVAPTRLTAVSSDATTAAIVFTNLTTTFTPARVGARYRLNMQIMWLADAVSTTGFWVYWKHGGTPTTADNQANRTLMRSHADAGGVDNSFWSVDIVATALTNITATLGLNLPNISGSDPGPVRLHVVTSTGTNAAQFGSVYWVDRVGY